MVVDTYVCSPQLSGPPNFCGSYRMNFFQLIKKVLDDAWAEIEGTKKEKFAAINAELERLSPLYLKLAKKYQNIDYSHPVTRFAYLYAYVVSHAHLVHERISLSKPLRDLFTQKRVMVSCVGGGPGSELLGILKHLEYQQSKKDHCETLVCHMYDKETAWGETWAGLFEHVESGVNVLPAFNSFDVTDEKSWKKFAKFLQSDLFTMIYFMSEVHGLKNKAEPFFDYLFQGAKSGALFLFIDNRSDEFYDWFDSLAKRHRLKILESASDLRKIPSYEEKTDLKEYFENLRSPKLEANIAWRVARKP